MGQPIRGGGKTALVSKRRPTPKAGGSALIGESGEIKASTTFILGRYRRRRSYTYAQFLHLQKHRWSSGSKAKVVGSNAGHQIL